MEHVVLRSPCVVTYQYLIYVGYTCLNKRLAHTGDQGAPGAQLPGGPRVLRPFSMPFDVFHPYIHISI